MFARYITVELKPKTVADFPRVVEKEIIPLLRKHKGFLDELVLVSPNKVEAIAISLWEEKEHAEAYSRATYPEVVKILGKYIEGTPLVKAFDVEYATFRKVASPAFA
jgi:hypothetical protein